MPKEYLRCRCPFCGMMPYVEDVLAKDELSDLEVYKMSFGGSRPLDDDARLQRLLDGKAKRGSGRGIINYEVVSEEVRELLEELRENLRRKARSLLSG